MTVRFGSIFVIARYPHALDDEIRQVFDRPHIIQFLCDLVCDRLPFGHPNEAASLAFRNVALAPHVEPDFLWADTEAPPSPASSGTTLDRCSPPADLAPIGVAEAPVSAYIEEREGSRVYVELNDVAGHFHRPHPEKEARKGAVDSVRRFLKEAVRPVRGAAGRVHVGRVQNDAIDLAVEP